MKEDLKENIINVIIIVSSVFGLLFIACFLKIMVQRFDEKRTLEIEKIRLEIKLNEKKLGKDNK